MLTRSPPRSVSVDGRTTQPQESGHTEQETQASWEAPAEISALRHVAVRTPPFWRDNPAAWFTQLESLFACQQINSDLQRYHTTVAGLDSETVADLMDVLQNPPASGKFQNLKQQVLARHGDTAQRRLHKLLSGLSMGDRTPAQLLRHMRTLAGNSITDDALRVRWLHLLPSATSRMLRLLREASLDELAQAADELADTSPDICAVRPAPDATADSATLAKIAKELSALRNSTDRILEYLRPANGGARQRGRSRSRTGGRAAEQGELCFYHERFGDKAENCRPPCGYALTSATRPGNR
ncbi:uncharacterized protein LOC131663359 [Phymastichus coffea]|uniref:uncharacterized protein LOC131663359 n=1 Tax=Phymastichus coffea TaxID=108790 RepID=UPI00273C8171|nr:uncharacterized protein LOC131663359 [Phymastichus coffea]